MNKSYEYTNNDNSKRSNGQQDACCHHSENGGDAGDGKGMPLQLLWDLPLSFRDHSFSTGGPENSC